MSNIALEQLAIDFLHLMPLFRKHMMKPFEQTAKALSPMQIHILHFLLDKEPLSMSALAEQMKVVKQQISFLTNKLEENNLIQRVHSKKDRRTVKISITQQGIDALNEHRQVAIDLIVSKLEQLTNDDILELQGSIHSMHKIMSKL